MGEGDAARLTCRQLVTQIPGVALWATSRKRTLDRSLGVAKDWKLASGRRSRCSGVVARREWAQDNGKSGMVASKTVTLVPATRAAEQVPAPAGDNVRASRRSRRGAGVAQSPLPSRAATLPVQDPKTGQREMLVGEAEARATACSV
jgi:hypothetical protein